MDSKVCILKSYQGNMAGYYSCRVDIKYRLILSIEHDEIKVKEIIIIEDLNNHYD